MEGIQTNLQTINVSIVGSGGCGKTTYIKKLLENNFEKLYLPTTFSYCYNHTILKDVEGLVFNIFDTDGTVYEIKETTDIIDKVDYIIVMYDSTSRISYEKALKYLEYCNNNNKKCILVSNKTDINHYNSANIETDIKPDYKISVKTSLNLFEPFAKIKQDFMDN